MVEHDIRALPLWAQDRIQIAEADSRAAGALLARSERQAALYPELVAACQKARHEIERLAMVTGYEGGAHFPVLEQLRAVLAKAQILEEVKV